MRKDRFWVDQAQSPVRRHDRDQSHRGHGMGPTRLPRADAAHQQQLAGAGNARCDSGPKSEAGRPETDAHPERVARPPVEDVDAKGGDDEGDREVHHHDVYRMAHQRDGRPGVKLQQLKQDRTFSRRSGIAFALCHHADPPRLRRTFWPDHSISRAAVYLGGPAALAGCTGPQSTLDPAGPAAASIATLWWAMLAGAVVLFVLVMALFALAIWRPGWGARLSPARWIVVGGLCLPAVVLTPLVAYALITGERLLPRGAAEPLRIEAEARQWKWIFRYPGYGGIKTEGVL